MYNSSTIKSQLIGLIGWRQNANPEGEQLVDMLTSETGIFFNDQHPLLTIKNLIAVSEEYDLINYPDWNNTDAYLIGQIRRDGGNLYRCIQGHTNQQPPNTTYWELYNDFTAFMKEQTEAGIIDGLDLWLEMKIKHKSAKNLLERDQLFKTSPSFDDLVTKEGNFVGYEITPSPNLGVVTKINEIGLQFNANQTGIVIKLFHSESKTPIKTQSVDYTGNGSIQWVSLTDWVMDKPGTYFIGYDEDSITVQAINGIKNHNYSCNGANSYPFTRHFGIVSFNADSDGSELWDISGNSYSFNTNYGLNFRFHVACDYTDFIVEQRSLLKTVIAKSVAIKLLRLLAFNPNVNVNRNMANIDRNAILYEIDGDSSGFKPNGLRDQLIRAIKAVSIDFEGVDKMCLPCRKKGIRISAIGQTAKY